MRKCFTAPMSGRCVPSQEHVSISAVEVTVLGFRAFFEFDQNRVARTAYWNSNDPATVYYTTADLSGAYGAAGNGHSQRVPSTGQPSLITGGTYIFRSQTSDDGGATWRNVSCEESVVIPQSDERVPLSFDGDWTGQGYRREWADTPIAGEENQSFQTWFNGDHFTNGQPLRLGVIDDNDNGIVTTNPTDPNELVLCSKIEQGEYLGFAVRGGQLGAAGLENRKRIVYSMEIYSPPLGQGGVAHPDSASDNGMYVGMGHQTINRPGLNVTSSGGDYYSGTASFRFTLNGSGRWLSWTYIHQNRNSGGGFSYSNQVDWNNSFLGNWQRLDMEIVLNDIGVNNGEIHYFVDGVEVVSAVNLEIREFADQWANGFGMFHEHRYVNPTEGEQIYYRNLAIYSRAA